MQNAFETQIKHMITNQSAEATVDDPQIQEFNNPSPQSVSSIQNPKSKIENCNGQLLFDELESLLTRFVILPAHAAETLALWVVHTYAFELGDVSTYLGIESPEKRCGKTTLLGVLSKLVNRPIAASNISSSAFFRVIQEMRPTLLIDKADTFLRNNDELRGILNSGYTRDTAYVIRMQASEPDTRNTELPNQAPPSSSNPCNPFNSFNSFNSFSCWCPKVMAAIGRLPDTLADRCIVIRMQRKTIHEECERLRGLDTAALRERCAQFVKENATAIATARPAIPDRLNDRAADIWEPLLALADIAGGDWPAKARRAAEGLTASTHGRSPIGALLFDIYYGLLKQKSERIFSRDLVDWLNGFTDRPWVDLPGLRLVNCGKRKQMTELWLAQQLRPYGIRPRTIRIAKDVAKGNVLKKMSK